MLHGKTAIITGANRGIGSAIVREFAANGCSIWACARTPSAEFEQTLAKLAEENDVWIRPLYFDITDEAAMKTAVKGIIAEKKPVDILINNAGIPYGAAFLMTPVADLRKVFEVNYFAQIALAQQISRFMMRQKRGSIVNVASVGGIEASPGYLAYGSSKAALIWATRMMAKELGVYGIRVNALAPGMIMTDMGGQYKTEEELQAVIQRTGLKRMGKKEEVARAALFLASEDASFVTGEILQIDGGRI